MVFILSICLFLINLILVSTTRAYDFAEKSGLKITGEKAGYDSNLTPEPVVIIGQTIEAVLSLLGIIFLAFMIYAGVTWLTAQGDDQKALKAKKILETAIVGLIIVIGAYAITFFVINYFVSQGVVE